MPRASCRRAFGDTTLVAKGYRVSALVGRSQSVSAIALAKAWGNAQIHAILPTYAQMGV